MAFRASLKGGKIQGGSLEAGSKCGLRGGSDSVEGGARLSVGVPNLGGYMSYSWIVLGLVVANLVIAALALIQTQKHDTTLNGMAIFMLVSASIVAFYAFFLRFAFQFAGASIARIASPSVLFAIFLGLATAQFIVGLIQQTKVQNSLTASNSQKTYDLILLIFSAVLIFVVVAAPLAVQFI